MATIENRLRATASYHVRLHGKYNPFGYGMLRLMDTIKGLGHEIGLHYEPVMAERRGLDRGAYVEMSLLDRQEVQPWPW